VSLYRSIARQVLAPTMDLIRGTHTMRTLRELEASQWWPRERLDELQAERLNRLVTHAYERVPYYRRIMDERSLRPSDIRSAADLQKLPVLTRDLVRANFDDLMAEGFPSGRVRKETTGGSTGTPLLFYTTEEDQRTRGFSRAIRAAEFAGLRLGDKGMLIRIARRHPSARDRLLHRLSRRLERVVELDSRDITVNRLPDIVALLHRADMRCLTGYPSAVAYLASWISESGVTPPELEAVITGGEQLFEHQRQRIRNAFRVEPYSDYSSREVFNIAMECEAHTGLHIAAEDIVVEVVDESNAPLSTGREGRIILTNLHNYAMPFIRYENGDSGSLVAEACPCGRALPLLSHVVGRRCDIVYTSSGRRISGSNLGLNRLAQLPVQQFQLVQEDLDLLTVRVAPRPGTEPAGLEDMRLRIPPIFSRIVGDDMRVVVQFCDHIEPTAAGKHLFVISKVDPDSWVKRAGA